MQKMTFLMFLFFSQVNSHAQSIDPGIWKDSSQFTVNDLPMPNDAKEECITPEQSKDVKLTIAKDLKKIGCSISKWKVNGQQLEASLNCQSEQINATGTVTGKFTK